MPLNRACKSTQTYFYTGLFITVSMCLMCNILTGVNNQWHTIPRPIYNWDNFYELSLKTYRRPPIQEGRTADILPGSVEIQPATKQLDPSLNNVNHKADLYPSVANEDTHGMYKSGIEKQPVSKILVLPLSDKNSVDVPNLEIYKSYSLHKDSISGIGPQSPITNQHGVKLLNMTVNVNSFKEFRTSPGKHPPLQVNSLRTYLRSPLQGGSMSVIRANASENQPGSKILIPSISNENNIRIDMRPPLQPDRMTINSVSDIEKQFGARITPASLGNVNKLRPPFPNDNLVEIRANHMENQQGQDTSVPLIMKPNSLMTVLHPMVQNKNTVGTGPSATDNQWITNLLRTSYQKERLTGTSTRSMQTQRLHGVPNLMQNKRLPGLPNLIQDKLPRVPNHMQSQQLSRAPNSVQSRQQLHSLPNMMQNKQLPIIPSQVVTKQLPRVSHPTETQKLSRVPNPMEYQQLPRVPSPMVTKQLPRVPYLNENQQLPKVINLMENQQLPRVPIRMPNQQQTNGMGNQHLQTVSNHMENQHLPRVSNIMENQQSTRLLRTMEGQQLPRLLTVMEIQQLPRPPNHMENQQFPVIPISDTSFVNSLETGLIPPNQTESITYNIGRPVETQPWPKIPIPFPINMNNLRIDLQPPFQNASFTERRTSSLVTQQVSNIPMHSKNTVSAQRKYQAERLAGIRTHPLVNLHESNIKPSSLSNVNSLKVDLNPTFQMNSLADMHAIPMDDKSKLQIPSISNVDTLGHDLSPSQTESLTVNEASAAIEQPRLNGIAPSSSNVNSITTDILPPLQEGSMSDKRARSKFPGMSYSCAGPRRDTGVEDLLCMEPPKFLPEYKNPCWLAGSVLRCLPYFHLIGMAKSGTTDLFQRMFLHPEILRNNGSIRAGREGKEIWFWSLRRLIVHDEFGNHTKGMTLKEFTDLFNATEMRRATDESGYHFKITGHGDPMDIYNRSFEDNTPQNIPGAGELLWTAPFSERHIIPNVKILIMLRDPAERLYTHYLFRALGTTREMFDEFVHKNVVALDECLRSHTLRSCCYPPNSRQYPVLMMEVPFLCTSIYTLHIKEWLRAFPREQMFIFKNEDYSKDIGGTLRRVFQFLNVSMPSDKVMREMESLPRVFITYAKQAAGPMLESTRTFLDEFFQPYMDELASFLQDKRFSYWK